MNDSGVRWWEIRGEGQPDEKEENYRDLITDSRGAAGRNGRCRPAPTSPTTPVVRHALFCGRLSRSSRPSRSSCPSATAYPGAKPNLRAAPCRPNRPRRVARRTTWEPNQTRRSSPSYPLLHWPSHRLLTARRNRSAGPAPLANGPITSANPVARPLHPVTVRLVPPGIRATSRPRRIPRHRPRRRRSCWPVPRRPRPGHSRAARR